MTQRDPVSIFWGPHRGFEDLAQWPPTIHAHLQLFGLQPGSEATPPLPPELFTPHILTPFMQPGTWFNFDVPFLFLITHTVLQRSLLVSQFFLQADVFTQSVPFAIHRWLYNALTDPAGSFAFNGSATLSWKEP